MPRKKRKRPPKGYRSGFEKIVADKLTDLKIDYEFEKIKVPYILERKYVSDFSFDDILLETKGYLRKGDITKMRAVKKQHPDLRIVFLFQSPDKPMSGSKTNPPTTHAQWAEKNGFEWITIDQLETLKPSPTKSKRLRTT